MINSILSIERNQRNVQTGIKEKDEFAIRNAFTRYLKYNLGYTDTRFPVEYFAVWAFMHQVPVNLFYNIVHGEKEQGSAS